MKDHIPTPGHDLYAAIDLGTNTCLLLVARWDGSRLIPLARELRVVRLGAGVDYTGQLSEQALARAAATFREYQGIIESYNCRRVRCVATSAFREATNRDQLHKRLKDATGYDLVEISGREEAKLVLQAVQHEFPYTGGNRVVADVGGGSTEIAIEKDGCLVALESMPLGSVRLTERWFHHDPPSSEELSSAAKHIDIILDGVDWSLPVSAIVGVGGTVTTFAAINLKLEKYDHSRIHGAVLTVPILEQILALCTDLPLQERLELPGLHPGRADVIIAGGMILRAVMRCLKLDRLTVSDRGLRWGVVMELVEQDS
ncbi:MAG: Ppx/GppA family phosphatase [Fidelibacterota bacterium]|nr:MAG: Ppx/GppA family phosphatase [Candidatus Neomarinimicrobiota bacterium]